MIRRDTWEPMSADTATENVATMRLETSRRSQIALLRLALTMPENFTVEALNIYKNRLAELLS